MTRFWTEGQRWSDRWTWTNRRQPHRSAVNRDERLAAIRRRLRRGSAVRRPASPWGVVLVTAMVVTGIWGLTAGPLAAQGSAGELAVAGTAGVSDPATNRFGNHGEDTGATIEWPASHQTDASVWWLAGHGSDPTFEVLANGKSGSAFKEKIRPTVWYQIAAAEHEVSPELLEALHAVESNAAPDGCVRNLQGSGAVGPFQFKPATFARFGVDANHDGRVDICGFSDSLFSAARYLRAIGADTDPTSKASRQALARYGTDVDRVVSLARAYQDRDR